MKVEEIRQAVQSAQQIGWNMPDDICEHLHSLENPQYRVFVAGEFQVGKSLLADRVYLNGEGLIRSGYGLPTTSVVTEVVYGERLSMRVSYRNGDASTVIPNPSVDDVAKYTTAQSENERRALAENIEKVVISVPAEKLKKYAILDSPGLDDANETVLAHSTFPQLLAADAVILVIPPRALDSIEKDFLQGFLFEKSISRLMIMISYNPLQPKSKKVREELVEHIKAELASMGRGYVPVRICCYDSSVDEELNTPEKIREAIDAFAVENVELGRIQRVKARLLDSFAAYENELRARLSLIGADKEDIEKLKNRLQEMEWILSSRLLSAKSGISLQEMEIIMAMQERLSKELTCLKDKLMARFKACEGLGGGAGGFDRGASSFGIRPSEPFCAGIPEGQTTN